MRRRTAARVLRVPVAPAAVPTAVLAAALVVVLAGASGCALTPVTPPGGDQTAADLKAPVGARVSIVATGFEPRSVTIRAGQSVVWENVDEARHNVGGASLVSGPLEKGESYTHAFAEPGAYQYLCTLHPEAGAGQVLVEPR